MQAQSREQSLRELVDGWKTSPEPSGKVSSYFEVYTKLFDHLRGSDCVFIETGILDGGSLFMWRKWLGERARIIGIDLNPGANKWESSGFEIHIGDQGDPQFWRDALAKIGQFDVLLDDGGHKAYQQIVTATEAIAHAKQECLVVIEDTFTSFMRDFGNPSDDSFLEYAKAATDCLIGRGFGMYPKRFPSRANDGAIDQFRNVIGIEFFSGIVSFHVKPSSTDKVEVLSNRPATGAADFRHEGKTRATVAWPNVLRSERRVVGDGLSRAIRAPVDRMRGLVKKVLSR